ncbi:hypothetical protein QJS10_CPA10g00912 [Acorus calamus]|uniref:Reverse transcriptase n=1 Tax=Acorus calamus TaxID=4465 RepID=A0AAV9DXT4_ACOCL|nr:hypothetical protein QJS10_CPA10g00912 [Acorus calamus]
MREAPSLARLDRVLLSAEWESRFSGCSVVGLPRSQIEGFVEVVAASWSANTSVLSGTHQLAFKLKRLRRHLRAWAREARASRGRVQDSYHRGNCPVGLGGRIEAALEF